VAWSRRWRLARRSLAWWRLGLLLAWRRLHRSAAARLLPASGLLSASARLLPTAWTISGTKIHVARLLRAVGFWLLSCRSVHPFDRNIQCCGLILNPARCLAQRGAALSGGRTPRLGGRSHESGLEPIAITRLDPCEKSIAVWQDETPMLRRSKLYHPQLSYKRNAGNVTVRSPS
jgi:hypothetical protein